MSIVYILFYAGYKEHWFNEILHTDSEGDV